LVENACQSSPVPTVAFDITNPGISGQDEATMAVKELDCFKSRSTKVQSLILKLQEIVERAKKDKDNAEQKLQNLTEEIRQKDTLLQAKSLELRRRHGKALETEKALQGEIGTFKNEKAAILKENARLHELCRQKDLQILQRVQDIKAIQQQVNEREMTHKQNLANMRKKVEEAWGLYESVKTRAEKRTAEFSEAAEKLKASQGYLLDLWQTLKTVDNVVEANEQDEL
jgi:predicted  nucleic acid-binding Zn-ribbon protein